MKLTFNSREELESFFEKEVLTTAQAMEVLGLSRARINAMVTDGKLKPIKAEGRTTLFLLSDLEQKKKELEQLRKKYRPYDE